MNWLRKKVSGKRNRLKQGDYDLDITYITERILAMSFPAQGFESCYRNSMSDVANYLEEKHRRHHRIYNLSNRKYNPERFRGSYRFYEWEDHHSPPIEMLFEICKDMYEFMEENKKNVVVVHCNAGKGRTGTSIACLLIYSGFCRDAEEATKYYGRKRFKHGLGITQPSQL